MDFDPLHGADEVLMESVELFWYLVISHYHTYCCCWLTQNMLVSVAVVHTGVRGILDLVLLTGQYHTHCFQRPLKVCVRVGIVHTIPLFLYVIFPLQISSGSSLLLFTQLLSFPSVFQNFSLLFLPVHWYVLDNGHWVDPNEWWVVAMSQVSPMAIIWHNCLCGEILQHQ